MDKQNNIEDIYPLSPMQQGILFHTLFAPDSGVYIPQICITLTGNLDNFHLKQAWEKILTRHSILRTAFNWERRDKPFQVVYKQLPLPWFEKDWRKFSPDEQQKLLENFLKQDRQQNFDLKKPPLIRLNLIQLSAQKYVLVWTQHHLILDGWSSALVIKEVFTLYQNKALSLSRPYGEYITWLNQQDILTAKQFWQAKLKGFTNPTSLNLNSSLNSVKKDEKQINLSETTTTALKSFARQHQLTLNTLIQSAFAILLSRYSGEKDIVFGATCSGRPPTLAGVESMVGLFINTLPVRVYVSPELELIPWLKTFQTQQLETLEYEYSSLLDIQQWSDLPAGSPLFEHILVFENYPVDPSFAQDNEDLSISEVNSIEWTSFPLTVLVGSGSELSIKIKYDCDRFSSATIAQMLGHFKTLLENMTLNPQQCLGTLTMLTAAEQQQLLVEWNNTHAEYPKDQCLHQKFETQVEKTPNAVAVVFEDQQLTYQELNHKANQLAHYLQSLGIKPGVLVGICVERSLEMVIGILGILKAGGAYVPIDPTYPQERQLFMLTDAQFSVVLTQKHLSEILQLPQIHKIILDNNWKQIASYSPLNPTSQVSPEHEIYVIYTSGSTGTPKGVINTHKALINRLVWMQKIYQLTASDRILQKTSFSFDVSVWEIFWPLLEGACLVLAKPGGQQDSSYLIKLIKHQQITTLHFVPSMLQIFLENPQLQDCQSIKRVICSGEALSVELQNRFLNSLNAELYNLYGPTEAAIDVTYWKCKSEENIGSSVPIGRPISNTQIYLLDSNQQLVPIGVPGELHIGGDGLARGYYNRPELTAEKFIPNPFFPSKLYKTGDLARYRFDGTIEFLGRIDYQVKIRGFRVELGEIEAVLLQHPEVKEAVVMTQNQAENKFLIAYIVPKKVNNEQDNILLSLLPCFLEEKLPQYMIPSQFIILEKFPLSLNGKLDRKQLLKLNQKNNTTVNFVAPRNPTEEKIATIWCEVLKLETIGIYDNFFELGGNSLLAIRVNTRLYQTFKLDLPLRTLFEKPTIASLAERINVMYMTFKQFS